MTSLILKFAKGKKGIKKLVSKIRKKKLLTDKELELIGDLVPEEEIRKVIPKEILQAGAIIAAQDISQQPLPEIEETGDEEINVEEPGLDTEIEE